MSESASFGDILLDSFEDSYNNLTVKTLYMLRHYKLIFRLTDFEYFLKTDDDSFIFVGELPKTF